MLASLLTNAIEASKEGGHITVHAYPFRSWAKGELRGIQVVVADNGSGIAPQDLLNIFDRFYRGDKSRQQNGESGLGLAISKSIVEVHHGTIAVESQPGQGAVFTVTLPACHL